MMHVNQLRRAVENRKKQLIQALRDHSAVPDTERLNAWTLSELEREWSNYQRSMHKEIG